MAQAVVGYRWADVARRLTSRSRYAALSGTTPVDDASRSYVADPSDACRPEAAARDWLLQNAAYAQRCQTPVSALKLSGVTAHPGEPRTLGVRL